MTLKKPFRLEIQYMKDILLVNPAKIDRFVSDISASAHLAMSEEGLDMLKSDKPVFLAALIASQPFGPKKVYVTTWGLEYILGKSLEGTVFESRGQIISCNISRIAHQSASKFDPTLIVFITDDFKSYKKFIRQTIDPLFEGIDWSRSIIEYANETDPVQ